MLKKYVNTILGESLGIKNQVYYGAMSQDEEQLCILYSFVLYF